MEDDDTEPSPISLMQAEVVDCLALLMSKEEEAFEPYLSAALSDVWTLLMATTTAPHQDVLVTTAIKFLQTVASSPHHQLFATEGVLQNVCEKIIAPNVQLLDNDEVRKQSERRAYHHHHPSFFGLDLLLSSSSDLPLPSSSPLFFSSHLSLRKTSTTTPSNT